jgi:hypothetical protein
MTSLAYQIEQKATVRTAKQADGVRTMLRLEGLMLLAIALGLYARMGGGWTVFAVLFLVPDLSMLFYVFGTRAGAAAYNAAHSTVGPLALCAVSILTAQTFVLALALIWLAHIGFDRALGYGLKYADGFGHTHLGWIGKKRA